ncbi:helix-turn-helix domain-containing protein [Haliscomenobacter hydrossis]|uniref:Transcriptional regulator, AraC family n=1 Tax=Haliscomenobacter hydrossis (strain ATCC 27775 / DSM 1100 / LMG 10767 / O) TaxID=760192 RepID=F4KY42_HALH1|nr:AraC family transcriptional regulator [Haliscomenobacter hydrossis]AEE53667.1 transcriptional regulator, AraC family [Haliscomenobacter hydrossis DSM 1100]
MALKFPGTNQNPFEKVFSKNLYVSDFYEIKHWSYDFTLGEQDKAGFNDCLCLVYIQKGNFLFDLSRKAHEMYSGYILLEKQNYEYKMRPSVGACTIFNFTNDFYQQFLMGLNLEHSFFFSNPNLISLVLQSAPETDYLHHQILQQFNVAAKLEMDHLVLDFFNQVARTINNLLPEDESSFILPANGLNAVELAREYIHKNFIQDISLQELSTNCFVSPFHFSRVFKKITAYSPHQYLQQVRLKHGEMLLKNSSIPVAEVAYACGFSSPAYFATAFKQRYKLNPAQYRKSI